MPNRFLPFLMRAPPELVARVNKDDHYRTHMGARCRSWCEGTKDAWTTERLPRAPATPETEMHDLKDMMSVLAHEQSRRLQALVDRDRWQRIAEDLAFDHLNMTREQWAAHVETYHPQQPETL